MAGRQGTKRRVRAALASCAVALCLTGPAAAWHLVQREASVTMRHRVDGLVIELTCFGDSPGLVRFRVAGRDLGDPGHVTLLVEHADGARAKYPIRVVPTGEGLQGDWALPPGTLDTFDDLDRIRVSLRDAAPFVSAQLFGMGLARWVIRHRCGF